MNLFKVYLKQSCKFTEDCQEIKYSVCSKNNKCVCKQNYTAWGDTECKALIGEYCDGSEECLFQDSTCSDNKCQCRENFTSQSGKYCKPGKKITLSSESRIPLNFFLNVCLLLVIFVGM